MPMNAFDLRNGNYHFTLAKLSVAVDPNSQPEGKPLTKFSWKHYQGDVAVMFDSSHCVGAGRSGSYADPPIMRCIVESQVMITTNIVQKVQLAREAIDHAKKYKIQLRADQLPTSGIHRRAGWTVAIRYPSDDQPDSSTRIQLKFATLSEYERVMDYFDRLGLPLSTAQPKPDRPMAPDRLAVSTGAHLAQTVSYQVLDHVQDDFATRYSTSHLAGQADEHADRSSPLRRTSYDHDSMRLPVRRLDFARQAVPETQSQSQSSLLLSGTAPFTSDSHQSTSDRDLAALPTIAEDVSVVQEVGETCPPASSSALDATTPSSRTLDYEGQLRPNTAQAYGGVAPSSVAYDFSHRVSSSPTRSHAALDSVPQRPSTAPLQRLEESLASMIPPKRALPFQRPLSATRRRTSVVCDLPALPKPTIKGESSRGDKEEQISTGNSKGANSDSPALLKKTPATPFVEPSSKCEAKPPAKRRATAKTKQAVAAVRSSPPSKPFSDDTFETARTSPARPTQLAQLPSVESALGFLSPAQTFDGIATNLASYAKQPYGMRESAVEAMVMQMIEDENFTTLCEDVEGCWKRIGLDTGRRW